VAYINSYIFIKYGEILRKFSTKPSPICLHIKQWLQFDPNLEKMWRGDLTIVAKPHGINAVRAGRVANCTAQVAGECASRGQQSYRQ
jgi:hypothetical protein